MAAVELSHRYITSRFLPDKAIDLVDEDVYKRQVFNCSPYVENYGGRVASVIAFGGKYRLRFRAACLTGRVPYIGRPSCGAAVYGVCQLNRMPMPAYMV